MNDRKPLNIEHWGRLEVWDGLEVAGIIAGLEPDLTARPWAPVEMEFFEVLDAASIVGTLLPILITSLGERKYLAIQIIKLAKDKNFSLPEGLEAKVRETAVKLARSLEAKPQPTRCEATPSPHSVSAPQPCGPEEPAADCRGDVKAQLWKIADETAASVRNGGASVSLNAVCKELCKKAVRDANKALLHGQKGWHTESWLKMAGHLKGWKDPILRK